MAKQLKGEAALQFEEEIKMVLSRWSALQLAVDNNLGGPHSWQIPSQLSHFIYSLFTTSKEKVCDDHVVPILKDSMVCLNMEFFYGEDAEYKEYKEIAATLRAMHEECLEGNFNSIKKLKEAVPPRRVPYIQQDDSDDDDDDDGDDTIDDILSNYDSSEMLVDAPKTGSRDFQVDVIDSPQTDDGWTVVGGSRQNRGRRN